MWSMIFIIKKVFIMKIHAYTLEKKNHWNQSETNPYAEKL